MKHSTADSAESESSDHPPLAYDALGNLLPLPDGVAAWRICRHTAGRPRILTGPDGAAMRFPLTTTAGELVDLCGPDTYRIYALDEMGEVLDFVTMLQATRPRNANAPDVPLAAALRVASGVPDAMPTSDLRFALHALTEIARINGEALRTITDSQADWIKTLAMNKGLPRNVAYPMLEVPSNERGESHDEPDRDEPDEEDREAPAADPMMQFLSTVTPLIPGLLAEWRSPNKSNNNNTAPSATAAHGVTHLARVQHQLDQREREFLAVLLADVESGEVVAAELGARSVEEVVMMIRKQCPKGRETSGPPRFDAERLTARLRERALTLLPRLSPPEQARLLALAPKVNPRALGSLGLLRKLDELTGLDDAAAVAWIEANLDEIEKAVAS